MFHRCGGKNQPEESHQLSQVLSMDYDKRKGRPPSEEGRMPSMVGTPLVKFAQAGPSA
jgi:hypothetical protein